jgi:uncharacterized phage protein (TIGR02216 family)
MAAGLGVLRLSPHSFWSMTPKEIAAALAPLGTSANDAPSHADLAQLMARFPDRLETSDG